MIYTITTNPSLDYYLIFDGPIVQGDSNRSVLEMFDAGGKGVNVSIFLNSLGIQSACLGFLGGFTKEYFLEHLKQYRSIQPLFTNIKDNTRINIKTEADNHINLNARGPKITDEEFNKFTTRLTKIYDTDYVVLSGNIQDELDNKIISVMEELSSNGIKIILDTDRNIMEGCLEYKPFILKLNERDAGVEEEQILKLAKEYVSKGVKYVLYSSLANDNFYLISEEKVYKASRLFGTTPMTGSGDSMIAGFLFSTMRGANGLEAFKYAVACLCKLRLINNQTTRQEIEEAVKELEVIEL